MNEKNTKLGIEMTAPFKPILKALSDERAIILPILLGMKMEAIAMKGLAVKAIELTKVAFSKKFAALLGQTQFCVVAFDIE